MLESSTDQPTPAEDPSDPFEPITKMLKKAEEDGEPFRFYILTEDGLKHEKTPVVGDKIATILLHVNTQNGPDVFCVAPGWTQGKPTFSWKTTDGGVLTVFMDNGAQIVTVYSPSGWQSYALGDGVTHSR